MGLDLSVRRTWPGKSSQGAACWSPSKTPDSSGDASSASPSPASALSPRILAPGLAPGSGPSSTLAWCQGAARWLLIISNPPSASFSRSDRFSRLLAGEPCPPTWPPLPGPFWVTPGTVLQTGSLGSIPSCLCGGWGKKKITRALMPHTNRPLQSNPYVQPCCAHTLPFGSGYNLPI